MEEANFPKETYNLWGRISTVVGIANILLLIPFFFVPVCCFVGLAISFAGLVAGLYGIIIGIKDDVNLNTSVVGILLNGGYLGTFIYIFYIILEFVV